MNRSTTVRAVLIRALPLAAIAVVGIPFVGGRPAAAFPTSLQILGHGDGHGRGMGQYGAYGYAQQGWTWQQIIDQYYGGTTLATVAEGDISVRLSELDGAGSISVSAPAGSTLLLNGQPAGTSTTVARSSTDQIVTATNSADVQVSGPWGSRQFAGAIVVKSAVAQVWNVLPVEQYVDGVVPREMPASWSTAALEAQAVAVRSYALAYTASGSPICDTTSCQVYGGDPVQYSSFWAGVSNAAVAATAGEVVECGTDSACGSPGQIAFTEYSASTGGYTAGGAFPAVVDAGDSIAANPYHDWSVTVPASTVQATWPSVGTLESVLVTSRNGLGDYGGRVLQVVVKGSAGQVTLTGAQFAGDLGLDSDWFDITNGSVPAGSDGGYWVVGSDGSVYPFGDAPSYGSMAGHHLNAPLIALAPTGDEHGYWLVAADGGIFSYGDAAFYGSTGNMHLNAPVVGMASTADSGGYWLVAGDGGIFNFGDAPFYGSTGNLRLAKPIVAMAPTPDGKGYWLVAADGGIFNFGDAGFYGSTGAMRLNAPVVGMVPTADGKGYWLVAADGGIFNFGDAPFEGSLGSQGVHDAVAVTPTPDDGGYLILGRNGTVYPFGDATWLGDPASTVANWSSTAVGISDAG